MYIQPLSRSFITYTHGLHGEIIYVGICRYSDAYKAPDARKNSEWMRLVKSDTHVDLTIRAECETRQEAERIAATLIDLHKPHCNINGKPYDNTTRIRCISDGTEFDSAADACRTYGIARQQMSAHLNGRAGHKSVKGRRFERIV